MPDASQLIRLFVSSTFADFKFERTASRAARLAVRLTQHRAEALLFRTLATLREDVPLQETLADLEWQGAYERLKDVCHRLGDEKFPGRVPRWRKS